MALVPGPEEEKAAVADYNKQAGSLGLLPAAWESITIMPPGKQGALWSGFSGQHPLTAPFREWSRTLILLLCLIAAVVMTGFCVLLFVYLLNLPFQLWPRYY